MQCIQLRREDHHVCGEALQQDVRFSTTIIGGGRVVTLPTLFFRPLISTLWNSGLLDVYPVDYD